MAEVYERYKGKAFLVLFALTAFILAWGAWENYRPTIIMASCSDIAYKSSVISGRYNVEGTDGNNFDQYLQDCMNSAGVNQ